MVDQRALVVNGVRLAHEVYGPHNAPPVVLLHALGEDARSWHTVAPALAAERRVYALDLRGHGRSEWPGTYSLQLMVSDVLGFLDARGLGAVDVVGHSLGGVVAHLLAQERPHRVARLVLEDVPVPRPRTPTAPVRPDGPLGFDWDVVTALRPQLDTPDPAWLDRLDRITAETLVVAGGPASHIPQDGVAELARRIPAARMITIPVGHMVHDEAPEDFTRAVAAFLSGR
ncbi:alpha/beta hydrolase [Streptomyces sp. Ru71]|uniref:alpha/beta fold hydrolase n=1 Tax=Streptomyces sp. Ru71 TaxID=2080746 RepID=UPI000CDDF486|nr:alpha/beta hydrolase [Streptomyces sp. Ru71]POX46696.1 alpha/beta hydrolase [Streptomyces sp. Ru71]